MGNAHIDLREASIQEKPAVLELNVVMGEIKLRAPRDWNIRVDDDTVMGDTKDERATRPYGGESDRPSWSKHPSSWAA